MNAAKGYHHAILQNNVSVSLIIYIYCFLCKWQVVFSSLQRSRDQSFLISYSSHVRMSRI